MKRNKPTIEVQDQTPLKWPEGWPRVLIEQRTARSAWKQPLAEIRKRVIKELELLGATSIVITRNEFDKERLDPGVAVWFSKAGKQDFGWQVGLHLDNPAPTVAEIDAAFRALIGKHHPDAVANGSGGDVKRFYQLDEWRKQAKAYVLGTDTANRRYCIPYDAYSEVRMNLAAIRLIASLFRGLQRLGMPTIVERVIERTFKQSLTAGSSPEENNVGNVA